MRKAASRTHRSSLTPWKKPAVRIRTFWATSGGQARMFAAAGPLTSSFQTTAKASAYQWPLDRSVVERAAPGPALCEDPGAARGDRRAGTRQPDAGRGAITGTSRADPGEPRASRRNQQLR